MSGKIYEIENEYSLFMWSILQNVTDDLNKFHSHLRILEGISGSDEERQAARDYLGDKERLKN